MTEPVPRPITRAKAVTMVANAIPEGPNAVLSQEQLVRQVEKIVIESGGEANPAASLKVLLKTLKSAEALGLFLVHRQVVVERLK